MAQYCGLASKELQRNTDYPKIIKLYKKKVLRFPPWQELRE
jgi:hypothetical protein